MAIAGGRLFVALDARAVCVAVLRSGLRRRLDVFARVPLEPGALSPSPSGPNLQRPEEVREALRRALDAAGRPTAACTLVLPDGVARLALLPAPRAVEAGEYVRFRLAASLPFPSAEAVADMLTAGDGRVVGAALRRGAVSEYEQAAASQGLAVQRVHLAPLLALGASMRAGSRRGVEVILGDAAACLAVLHGGTIAALSNRRRDTGPGEGERLLQDAERLARRALNGAAPRTVFLTGADSSRLRAEGGPAVGEAPLPPGAGRWPQAAEAAWLAGVS